MRLNSRTWMVISLLLFAGAAYFWHLGEKRSGAPRRDAKPSAATNASLNKLMHTAVLPAKAPAAMVRQAAGKTNLLANRLTNTRKSLGQLERSDSAILLRNALIDTAEPLNLNIPEHLKSKGDPGSWIVQSRKSLDEAFYSTLRRAGAQFVSYIPNNAALVTATPEIAKALAGYAQINSVLPYEPYYKLDLRLLDMALHKQSLGTNNVLKVTLFQDTERAFAKLADSIGTQTLGQEQTPFGTQLILSVPSNTWIELAANSAVQEVESFNDRAALNDLTRMRVKVSQNTLVSSNWLGLTGTNIVVNINDSGVDATHGDLQGRVQGAHPYDLVDIDGHGTHVAGIIAGDGTNSPTVKFASGSLTNADFRGKAPLAKLFVQSLESYFGPFITDSYLQTNAAANTNILISNNSWGYYGSGAYDMAAASYDAATRDAQPTEPGSQPLLFVFAAGNSGQGSDDGGGGLPDTLLSPAVAKNVISVGALESLRRITNRVTYDYITTNAVFRPGTDNASQVAWFSSRGNVGVGVEGEYGRFKPDLVAPGTFIVSTRATNWQDPDQLFGVIYNQHTDQTVSPGQTNIYSFSVPDNGTGMVIRVVANAYSPNPLPDLAIYSDQNPQPTALVGTNSAVFTVTPGDWFFGIHNPGNQPVAYDVQSFIVVTNNYGDYFDVLKQLNDGLSPFYRYETGTSMAAPAVSGVLALVQEFFETRLNHRPSPALMKAFLINGARSVLGAYDFQVRRESANDQGWGLVSLTNCVPSTLTSTSGPIVFFEQSPTNALATGQSIRRDLIPAQEALNYGLRVTLVWTDPPGNPAASIKLVNDLDLYVTNNQTGEVYVGNNFPVESVYSEASPTNSVASSDIVNNVENVFIEAGTAPLGTNYSICVRAKRVNVNALTAHTNGIVQDFALVISSALNNYPTNFPASPFTVSSPTFDPGLGSGVGLLVSGEPLLQERVGANSPLIGTTNGSPEQWHFYVFVNDPANPVDFTNVALVTFMPPNLSVPRNTDADIDLYVSESPSLLNFDAAAIAAATKSTNRGGTEWVVLTNSAPGSIYFVGVKSEDQQAAEYGIVGVATNKPFGGTDSEGRVSPQLLTGVPVLVPDGPPNHPGYKTLLALSTEQAEIRRVTVGDAITHELMGDLFGLFRHLGDDERRRMVYLNNHSYHGTNGLMVWYDDNKEGDIPDAIVSDGPGGLDQFVGRKSAGVWALTVADNALNHTGMVTDLQIKIDPKQTNDEFTITMAPDRWYYDYIDIPNDATNLTISLTFQSGGPIEIFLDDSALPRPPSSTAVDAYDSIGSPGGKLSYSVNDLPSLRGGRWYYALHNAGSSTVSVTVKITIQRALIPNQMLNYGSGTNEMTILDQATTTSQICITDDKPLVSLQVGVRIDHPRVSDLVLHLVSPQGTRALLFEDRGWDDADTLGLGARATTNLLYTIFTEDPNLASQFIKFAQPPFASVGIVEPRTDIFTDGFETITPGTYAGTNIGAWQMLTNQFVSNQVTIVHDPAQAESGARYLALADGRIQRTLPTKPGYRYVLTYAYRGPGITDWWPGDGKANDLINANHGTISTNGMFSMGVVARAFNFHGNAAEFVSFNTNVGNFGTNDFTVDFWIKSSSSNNVPEAVMDKRPQCGPCSFWSIRKNDRANAARIGLIGFEICENNAAANYAGVSSTTHINDGLFHHYAATRQGRNLSLYLDGVLETNLVTAGIANLANNKEFQLGLSPCINGPGMPDTTQPMLGHIDELDFFNRAITPAEVGAIYRAGTAGKYGSTTILPNAAVVAGGTTNLLISNDSTWQFGTNCFVAQGTNTVIELQGTALSLHFDSFRLVQLEHTNYNNYFLPEESLDVFKGENPAGCWSLEITDTRIGPDTNSLANGTLRGWDLQMTFSATNVDLVVLTNGVPYNGTVSSNSLRYFAVDVPIDAVGATNALRSIAPAGTLLDLLFNQDALPNGYKLGDFWLLTQTSDAAAVIANDGSLPFLQPGRRYYLSVRNDNPGAVDFLIRVDFGFNYIPPDLDQVIPLTNAVPVTAQIPATNELQYYYFDVSTNALSTAFEIFNLSGDVDLLAHLDLPLPDQTRFDYISSNQGTNNESIVILPDSSPVPLTPGRWYLGVYNYTNIPVDYTIRATETVPQIIELTDGAFYLDTVPAGPPYATFYALTLTNSTAAAVEFLVTNMNRDVDLLARRNAFPTMSRADRGSFNFGVTAERIVFATNAALPTLDGTWYLAVPNNTPTPASFRIRATTSNTGTNFPAAPFQFTALGVSTSGVTFQWNSDIRQPYAVDVSSDLQTWQSLTNIVSTTATTTFTDNTTAVTNDTRFYRLRQLPWP